MAAEHADAGRPMPADLVARPQIRYHRFEVATRQISLRNTGTNTLWISFDHENWVDVACGTSLDDRVCVNGFWHRTQTGRTSFVVVALQLSCKDHAVPTPTEEELGAALSLPKNRL
jgi:hypothetical protein